MGDTFCKTCSKYCGDNAYTIYYHTMGLTIMSVCIKTGVSSIQSGHCQSYLPDMDSDDENCDKWWQKPSAQ